MYKNALWAILFGSCYTIFRKYQSITQLKQSNLSFNQPILQSFVIFVGMSSIYLAGPCLSNDGNKSDSKMKWLYFIPSLLDVIGTIIDTMGLFYTSVSVSQMLKGSIVVFTYLITMIFFPRKLNKRKHILIVLILISLGTIWASSSYKQKTNYQSNPMLGNSLIVCSQLMFAVIFIYEEYILNKYNQIQVYAVVAWEGIWGTLISLLVLILLSSQQNLFINCDIIKSCQLIYENTTAICIAPFNYYGMTITKEASALSRCLVCTSRMIVVWMVSLIMQWESFSFLQLFGYVGLTYGIYQFNRKDHHEYNKFPISPDFLEQEMELSSNA